MIDENGSGFDSYIFSKKLPEWRSVINLTKTGAGNISLKIFNGYVDENKKTPQYVHLRSGRVHINSSL